MGMEPVKQVCIIGFFPFENWASAKTLPIQSAKNYLMNTEVFDFFFKKTPFLFTVYDLFNYA